MIEGDQGLRVESTIVLACQLGPCQVLVTTSRDPSSRLSQFLKELRMLFLGEK